MTWDAVNICQRLSPGFHWDKRNGCTQAEANYDILSSGNEWLREARGQSILFWICVAQKCGAKVQASSKLARSTCIRMPSHPGPGAEIPVGHRGKIAVKTCLLDRNSQSPGQRNNVQVKLLRCHVLSPYADQHQHNETCKVVGCNHIARNCAKGIRSIQAKAGDVLHCLRQDTKVTQAMQSGQTSFGNAGNLSAILPGADYQDQELSR